MSVWDHGPRRHNTAELHRTYAPGPHFSTHADIFFILWFQFCNVGPRQLAAPWQPKPKSIRRGRLWHGFSSRTQRVHDTHTHGSTVILCGRLIGFNFVYVGSFLCHLREYSSAWGPITASLCWKRVPKGRQNRSHQKTSLCKDTSARSRIAACMQTHREYEKKRVAAWISPFFLFLSFAKTCTHTVNNKSKHLHVNTRTHCCKNRSNAQLQVAFFWWWWWGC